LKHIVNKYMNTDIWEKRPATGYVRCYIFRKVSSMRLAFILYFFCFFSHATSCVISEKQMSDWNIEFSNLFDVNKKLGQGSYSIIVTIPKEIKDKEFDNVAIFKGSLENPSFFATLKPFEDEGDTKVWFTAQSSVNEVYYLNFGYGESCGISVTLTISVN